MSEKKDEAIREAAREMLTATVEGRGADRREGILRALWLAAEAETARRCAEIAVVNHGECGPPCNSAVAERRVQEAIRLEFGLGEGR